jgi:hypothetical protein
VGFTRLTAEFVKQSGSKPSRSTTVSETFTRPFEKRSAMPARKSLVCTLWLTSALALLASVLVEPIRTSASVSSRPDYLRRDFALCPCRPTAHVSAALATDDLRQVNALPSENEEQDRVDPLDEPRISFLIPCVFRKVPDRQLTAPSSILSLYPLRC